MLVLASTIKLWLLLIIVIVFIRFCFNNQVVRFNTCSMIICNTLNIRIFRSVISNCFFVIINLRITNNFLALVINRLK